MELLKLSGLKSFASPAFGEIIVKKGEIIRASDALAETLKKGGRLNAEGEQVSYWTEPSRSDGDKWDHDLSKLDGHGKVEPVSTKTVTSNVAADPETAPTEAVRTPQRKPASRQRAASR